MIHTILEELNESNSRLHKEAVLEKHKDNELFKRVLKLTYDPLVNFYIKKIPLFERNTNGGTMILEEALDTIENILALRKATGHTAINVLSTVLSELSETDADVLVKVIRGDLRCGISSKTINKIIKKHITEVPYMRCALYDEKTAKNITFPAISELKSDGKFANVIVHNGAVTITSRAGIEQEIHGVLDADFLDLAHQFDSFNGGVVFNGELLVLDDEGNILPREVGNGFINSDITPEQAKKIIIRLWDFIPLEKFKEGVWKTERRNRMNKLIDAIERSGVQKISFTEHKIVNNIQEAKEHYHELLARGEEGTILKDSQGIWKDGTSKHQLKLKVEMTVDLKVVGFNPGREGSKYENTLGAVLCESADGKLKVKISGFKEKHKDPRITRDYIWGNKEEFLGAVLQVKCNDITSCGDEISLFLPRFDEWRDDKTEADSLERIREIKEMNTTIG